MPYGGRGKVETLLREMEAQKHLLPMTKGKKKKSKWIGSQIRTLPFGFVEYIFPKEDLDLVLTTLNWEDNRYPIGKARLAVMRFILKCKKAPKYSTKKFYLWVKKDVNIIPLGIREDFDLTYDKGKNKGWKHEAL